VHWIFLKIINTAGETPTVSIGLIYKKGKKYSCSSIISCTDPTQHPAAQAHNLLTVSFSGYADPTRKIK
jgi:hypothetical protein